MTDHNYLLTYMNDKDFPTFEWFETEEELREFVFENQVKVIDAIYIHDCEYVF